MNGHTKALAAQVSRSAQETLRWKRRSNRMLAALIALALTAVALISIGAYREITRVDSDVEANRDAISLIHRSQIRACEGSKSPGGIRFIVAEQLRQELQQGKTVDYEQFFPNVPPDELNALIEAGRKRSRMEIQQLLGVDCAQLYPKIIP